MKENVSSIMCAKSKFLDVKYNRLIRECKQFFLFAKNKWQKRRENFIRYYTGNFEADSRSRDRFAHGAIEFTRKNFVGIFVGIQRGVNCLGG